MAQFKGTKRDVPAGLQNVLDMDVKLTKAFHNWASKILPIAKCSKYYKGLEISCHGVPWFAFWICFTWLFNATSLIQMQVNMLLGLVLDILFVAIIKAYTRRRRPAENTDDALGQLGPDKFSFPSGHASRAVFVTYFFFNLFPVSIFFKILIALWSTSVCISRILMRRHHILDVACGVLLGMFVGIVVGVLFIEEDTALWIMNSLTDEKLDGGEFHV